MLGILRFFLASCVVVFHLSAHVPNIGILAVNFFYVISGYLITLILNETYQFNTQKFFLNRFLRLFPTYYFIAAIALLLQALTLGAGVFHPSWRGPVQPGDWLGNAFMFPWAVLPEPSPPGTVHDFLAFATVAPRYRVIPSTWSVGVEIWCYFLLWAVIARRWFAPIVSLLIAIAWQLWLFQPNQDPGLHYAPVLAALLPFSLGSIAYFVARRTHAQERKGAASTATQFAILSTVLAAFMLNWWLSMKFDPSPFYGTFYYASSVLACLSVVALHGLKARGLIGRIATWLGDLSYPLFLAQYVGGYLAWHLLGATTTLRGWPIFFLGYAIAIAISICSVWVVDIPIKTLRSRIRSSAMAKRKVGDAVVRGV